MERYSIEEAAGILDVHRNTVMNRIRRGQLQAERVTEGGRERTYVLLDDLPEKPSTDMESSTLLQSTGQRERDLEEQLLASQHELELTRERNRGLENLIENLRDQVLIERERYSEIYADVKSGALALPAPKSRPWWRFWGGRP